MITDKLCDIFELYFKLGSLNGEVNHIFGYFTNLKLMTNWDGYIGQIGFNDDYSIGIHALNNEIYLYDGPGGSPCRKLKYSPSKAFTTNDIFGISFDFVNDLLTIYHNANVVEKVPLNGFKSIIPTFSLYNQKPSIHVVRYLFK